VAQRQRSHSGRGSGGGVLLPAGSLWLTALGRRSFPSKQFSFPGASFVARLAWQGAASLVVPGGVPVTSSYSSMPSRAAHDVLPDLGKPQGERAPSNRGCLRGTSRSAELRSTLRPKRFTSEGPFQMV
jgi:hypothetical protein